MIYLVLAITHFILHSVYLCIFAYSYRAIEKFNLEILNYNKLNLIQPFLKPI